MQKITWHTKSILPYGRNLYKKLCAQKRTAAISSDWWALRFSFGVLETALEAFSNGTYQFAPMQQFRSKGETIRMWGYMDRIVLRLLLKVIKPTFAHIIPKHCYHLQGPNGIKHALRYIENALETSAFHYAIRIDIKSYYASISHPILLEQVNKIFDDPKVKRYLTDIITTAVDDGGDVFLLKQGIPRRSSLSPFFGALYLSPLDRAFEKPSGVVYLRFMDDVLILCQTKRQYQKARKTLFKILRSLKLTLSPRKSWMGKLTRGFHFLGVNFEVAKPEVKNQPRITIHPRSCTRALDKVKTLRNNAVHPALVQRYLFGWGNWWASSVKSLHFQNLLAAWIDHTRTRDLACVWLGSGLLWSFPDAHATIIL
jgi:RNA-directed DNA polymerase